jgi:hypothetical protein
MSEYPSRTIPSCRRSDLRDIILDISDLPVETEAGVQIVHVGAYEKKGQVLSLGHWLPVSWGNDGVKSFDSSTVDRVHADTGLKINQRQRFSPKECAPQNCTQQVGSVLCGFLAVATITAVLHGDDPSVMIFDKSQLRTHLHSCLFPIDGSAPCMIQFPSNVLHSERNAQTSPQPGYTEPKSSIGQGRSKV